MSITRRRVDGIFELEWNGMDWVCEGGRWETTPIPSVVFYCAASYFKQVGWD